VLALAVPFPTDATVAELKTFRKRHNLTYPLLRDPKGLIAERFGASALPDNAVLTAQGKLAGKPEDVSEMLKMLGKLVK
jgi:peroxiredoxin